MSPVSEVEVEVRHVASAKNIFRHLIYINLPSCYLAPVCTQLKLLYVQLSHVKLVPRPKNVIGYMSGILFLFFLFALAPVGTKM